MITTDRNPPNSQTIIFTPRNIQPRRIVGLPEYQRAKAKLQQYLALLGFDDVERSQILEQVMSRAVAYGNPERLIKEALQELHRFAVSRTQSHNFISMPRIQRRHMVPKEIEYISCRGIWRSVTGWLWGARAQAQLSLGKIPGK